MIQIGKAVYNILRQDKVVVSKVLDKIYPLVADAETTFPFIVYKRTSIAPVNSKDRYVFSEDVYVDIVIASDKYNESIEIADSVRTALDGKSGTYANIGIQDITLTDADEDYIQDTFILNLTFKIKVQYGK